MTKLPDPPEQIAFDGFTYDPYVDYARLRGQLLRVYRLMQDGEFRTLAKIADECRGSEASVSARLRDFRKPKYGSRIVDRVRIKEGLYKYRLRIGATK
jgi:hypothetical protein